MDITFFLPMAPNPWCKNKRAILSVTLQKLKTRISLLLFVSGRLSRNTVLCLGVPDTKHRQAFEEMNERCLSPQLFNLLVTDIANTIVQTFYHLLLCFITHIAFILGV